VTYTILNRGNGSASEMFFENKEQLEQWLKTNPLFENLGIVPYTLPTRHVRMSIKK
tara:strand:+ start:334 stop:501 length:168 start_codon:yes stop_codon:yes gene_type:complete